MCRLRPTVPGGHRQLPRFRRAVEADGGRKLLARLGEYGDFQELLVRWNNGVVQQVTIGPTIGSDGKPAICVVARRHIGTQLSASAGR
jgi:hypothetical protein